MPAAPQMLPQGPLSEQVVSHLGSKHSQPQVASWQLDIKRSIRSLDELLRRLSLPQEITATNGSQNFPVLVSESFLRRMQPQNFDDPLLKQVLPVPEEGSVQPGFVSDPVGDLVARKAPGLLQKYAGRALLIVNGVCAIHCRYCFRREYPYAEDPRTLADWELAFPAIEADHSLTEIILSGGDPLMMSDEKLAALLMRIARIPHVQRVRIHSRLPVVLPSRVSAEFLSSLKSTRLQPIMVVHANHSAELVDDCAEALRTLVQSGIPTLNQAVLLKGVNDSTQALFNLCEACINLGVLPYYLHQLDRVTGAAHFEVPPERGRQLIASLRERLPGYAVPQYVLEIPGRRSKTPLTD